MAKRKSASKKKRAKQKNTIIAVIVVVVLLAIALGVCMSIESLRTPIITEVRSIYVSVVAQLSEESLQSEQSGKTQQPSSSQNGQETGKSDKGDANGNKVPPTPTTYDDVTTYVGAPTLSADQLSFHFLELGNKYSGDCTLVKIGDVEVLIDAGSIASSAATIVPYVRQYCTDGVLEYVVITHADQDHIAGFVGTKTATGIFDSFDVETIIQFVNTGNEGKALYNSYCSERDEEVADGAKWYTALQCWNETDGASRVYTLADGVTMEILYNYYYDHPDKNENNNSVCTLFSAGDKHYLFTGDLEKQGEEYLVQYNDLPKVELFKGGHHGSNTSNTKALIDVIQPKVVCVNCCCGSPQHTEDVANMFPTQDFFDHVLPYTELIFVTTMSVWDDPTEQTYGYTYTSCNGNIVVLGDLTIYCSYSDVPVTQTDWFLTHRTREN